jgi:two-component system sensor histidine kinase VicK
VTIPPHIVLPLQTTQHVADLTRETEQRVKAENALRESEMEYRSVVELLSEGIVVLRTDGTIASLNESAADMLGVSSDFLMGKQLLDLRWHAVREDGSFMPHEDHPALVTLYTGEAVKDFVMGLYQRDHSIRWLSVNTYPLRRPSELLPRSVAVSFTDITLRLRHERAMRESYDALDRLTSEFIGVVSHELRTPLTSIRGALKLLESDVFATLPPKAHTLLNIARSNTERLMRIIDDILDLEQLESGRMVIHPTEIDPMPLMQDAVATVRAAADKKSAAIVTDVSLPPHITTDRDRLLHVLEHLLSNAVKFSPDGSEVQLRASTLPTDRLLFEVIDHGVGIAPAMLDRLFRSFTQGDASDTRHPGGAGLGLAIARSTIERLGGRIGVESEQHVLTRFWFELPHAAATSSGRTATVSRA